MMDRLAQTAAIAVRQAGAYTDLLLSDLKAASRLMRRRIALGVTFVLCAHLAVLMACGWVVALSWDSSYRLWVIGALLLGFAAIALLTAWRLGEVDSGAPGVLQRTAQEWAKDRRLLEDLLARERAVEP